MHRSANVLSAKIRAANSLESQIDVMRNVYQGSTCAIVTCGPSLAGLSAPHLQASLRNVPTIAVKQAIDVVGKEADFHCWNAHNVSKFRWASPDTIRCLVEAEASQAVQWNEYDVSFPQVQAFGDLRSSLAAQKDFSDHLLSRSAVRPFGPGIMYELVIYLALHLGCTRLVTFGWDIADTGGRNTHFYDDADDRVFFERGRGAAHASRRPGWRNRLPPPVRRVAHGMRTRARHELGYRYNRTTPLPGESELVSNSTGQLHQWLDSIGVEVVAVTDSTCLPAKMRGLSADEAFELLRTSGA